jgi:cytochrome c
MASSLEGNKVFAAILVAGIIASGSAVFSRILYGPEELHESVFRVEGAEPAVAEAAPPAEAEPIAVRLAAADAGAGQAAARVCVACHSFEKGGANKVGPALWGVVNRGIAGHEGYSYSTALTGKGGVWDYDALDGYIASPRGWAPGTKMSFAGIGDPQRRAEIIAYLRSLADSPAPLPQASLAPPAPGS